MDAHLVAAGQDEQGLQPEKNKIISSTSSNHKMRTLGSLVQPPTDNPNNPDWPYVIGLAGGIASGKSKIIEKLKTKGVAVVNCDRIVNEKKLKKVVFADEDQAETLEQQQVVWPAVMEEAQRRIRDFSEEGYRVVVMKGADFMRAKWYNYCHQLWVAIIPRDDVRHTVICLLLTASCTASRHEFVPVKDYKTT